MASPLRCVYCDLDRTLPGRGGSFLHDADGAFSLLGARALEACARAEAEVVLYSAREQVEVAADARRLGIGGYAFDGGAGVMLDGELYELSDGTILGAVAFHMHARGLAPEECIAVAGALEDLDVADAVGTVWLAAADAPSAPGLRVTEEPGGAGLYEAVITELAERR